ncbi:hypothetical protein [Brachyspira sp.]|uniref:hypothetical protein n=1 Tax=Brachyspira sp. TaxID=1977261 RepID=UPI00262F68D1|nr:hypothetical protein [Brachyspira sp.]
MIRFYKNVGYANLCALGVNEEQEDLLKWFIKNLDIFEEEKPEEITKQELKKFIDEYGEIFYWDISKDTGPEFCSMKNKNYSKGYICKIIKNFRTGDCVKYLRLTPSQVVLLDGVGLSNWYDWKICKNEKRNKYSYDGSKFLEF